MPHGSQKPCGIFLAMMADAMCRGVQVKGEKRANTKNLRMYIRRTAFEMVERRRIELLTPCVQSRCSPS